MTTKRLLYIMILIVMFVNVASGQNKLTRNDTIEVWENGKQLKYPWAGGINGAQISEIDLNFDGLKDLFIFEANNRFDPLTKDKMIFLLKKEVSPGVFEYEFAPEYKSSFPKLEYFCALRDFNGDGKMDIFAVNSRFQISVYRNDSDSASKDLNFNLFIKDILSDANGLPPTFPFFREINQDFVNQTGFDDIDGDGDIDLLVLSRSEQFIEYHKNISPTRDTMIFELMNTCWGNAVVARDTIILGTCDPNGNVPNPERIKIPKNRLYTGNAGKGAKDAGVSLLPLDLNNDGVMDLISGNHVSLRMMMNNGTPTASNFSSFTTSYPASKPVKDMITVVIPSYVDVDHDNVKDLVASVIWDEHQDIHTMRFYKNTGTNTSPVFVHQTDDLFQEDMIDVGSTSFPIFFYYDEDTLIDMMVGNLGYFLDQASWVKTLRSQLSVYRNVGKPWEPKFELVTDDFLNLSNVNLDTAANKPSTSLHPAFGDIDGDGDQDMFVGDHKGDIHFFENTAGPNATVDFDSPVIDYQGLHVPEYAAPQVVDLNRDGLLDLVVGDRTGKLNYFQNVGTSTDPIFQLENDSLGNVFVKEFWDFWGHSNPFIYEDTTGELAMMVGSKSGYIYYYDSLESNGVIADTFPVADSSYQNIWMGSFASIYGADINADSSIDFVVGNISGGVTLFTGDPRVPYVIGLEEDEVKTIETKVYPNPAGDRFTVEVIGLTGNQTLRLTIADLVGKTVFDQVVQNKSQLDVSRMPPGVYVLQVATNLGQPIASEKLVIQR